MSWSISGVYRNVEHASSRIAAKQDLPQPIKEYIMIGLDGITDKEVAILIDGHGHLCYTGAGGGNYEQTTAKLEVRPLVFAP
jgi:hypothetical protein